MFMYNLLWRLFSTTGMPLILLISPAGTLAQDWPHSTKDELLDSVTVTGERPALNTSTTIITLSGDRLDRLKGGGLEEIINSVRGVSMLTNVATIAHHDIIGLY